MFLSPGRQHRHTFIVSNLGKDGRQVRLADTGRPLQDNVGVGIGRQRLPKLLNFLIAANDNSIVSKWTWKFGEDSFRKFSAQLVEQQPSLESQ